ncbi:MAG TPA: carbamoyltransferase N-terminal domain-containing protein, partial [Planctomycetaceae bacterium]|nr:carbamoyltransferase N-terminal domain-containing protein [Planctomycetaceae bacterium]
MTAILGISAFYHDSAAAIVVDGRIVAAAQEERFTRIKHDAAFPQHAVDYCLAAAGLSPGQVDYVCFYEKPLLKFERLLETYLAFAPAGFGSFLAALPVWVKQKLFLKRELDRGLKGEYQRRYVYPEHHESHAASAFYPSPFETAAILTVDGVGEWTTTAYGVGEGNRLRLTHELRFPHSLGMLYSAFTYFCGFRVNSGEYKLMGLAPYGDPVYADVIREKLIDIKPDGSFRLNLDYFNYCQGLTMTSRRFDRLFGGPPRKPESPLTEREMHLAASVQVVTEEILLKMAAHLQRETQQANLCLAGGVALNCVANGVLLRAGIFDDLWIQPAAGDAGGALGAPLAVWHNALGKPRRMISGIPGIPGRDAMQGALL